MRIGEKLGIRPEKPVEHTHGLDYRKHFTPFSKLLLDLKISRKETKRFFDIYKELRKKESLNRITYEQYESELSKLKGVLESALTAYNKTTKAPALSINSDLGRLYTHIDNELQNIGTARNAQKQTIKQQVLPSAKEINDSRRQQKENAADFLHQYKQLSPIPRDHALVKAALREEVELSRNKALEYKKEGVPRERAIKVVSDKDIENKKIKIIASKVLKTSLPSTEAKILVWADQIRELDIASRTPGGRERRESLIKEMADYMEKLLLEGMRPDQLYQIYKLIENNNVLNIEYSTMSLFVTKAIETAKNQIYQRTAGPKRTQQLFNNLEENILQRLNIFDKAEKERFRQIIRQVIRNGGRLNKIEDDVLQHSKDFNSAIDTIFDAVNENAEVISQLIGKNTTNIREDLAKSHKELIKKTEELSADLDKAIQYLENANENDELAAARISEIMDILGGTKESELFNVLDKITESMSVMPEEIKKALLTELGKILTEDKMKELLKDALNTNNKDILDKIKELKDDLDKLKPVKQSDAKETKSTQTASAAGNNEEKNEKSKNVAKETAWQKFGKSIATFGGAAIPVGLLVAGVVLVIALSRTASTSTQKITAIPVAPIVGATKAASATSSLFGGAINPLIIVLILLGLFLLFPKK